MLRWFSEASMYVTSTVMLRSSNDLSVRVSDEEKYKECVVA